jgi:hypothetical protein
VRDKSFQYIHSFVCDFASRRSLKLGLIIISLFSFSPQRQG